MHFDVIFIGDLRVPGGTARQLANQIRVLSAAGHSVGLVNVELPHARGRKPVERLIRARLAAGEALLVEEGLEDLSADLLVFENPRAFMLPGPPHLRVRARRALIAMHFPPRDGAGELTFDPMRVLRTCGAVTDAPLAWAATSALTRELFSRTYPDLPLMPGILPCIVFAEDFRVQRRRAPGARAVIGRHSRPQLDKWPADRRTLLQAYPAKDVDVVLLGADEQLRRLAGRYPANWRVYGFNDISPQALLQEIDFFVYHHHPRWVEAFGLATAEAMASGAVAILPPYMRANFGEGALYAEPAATASLVRSLHRDRKAYARQARRGMDFIRRHHSPEAYLRALKPLLGARSRRRAPPRPLRCDVLVLADLRLPGAEAARVAEEVQATAAAGYTVALLHCGSGKGGGRVRPEIDRLVRGGVATAVDGPARARLMVCYGVQPFLSLPERSAAGVEYAQLLVVLRELPVPAELGLLRRLADERLVWGAATRAVREQLEALEPGGTIIDWPALCAPQAPRTAARKLPALALVTAGIPDAASLKRVAGLFPQEGGPRVRLYGAPRDKVLATAPLPAGWETFKLHELPLGKLLDGADLLLCTASTPDAAAAQAMARGLPLVAVPQLRREFGEAALYSSEGGMAAAARKLLRNRKSYAAASRAAHARGLESHSPEAHARRLRGLLGKPAPRRARVARAPGRILMFSQNGVGLGHVVRQLAVSRHLSRRHEVLFCSMSQALEVIAAQGYHVEHLPSHVYSGVSYADWHGWARAQLEQMIDYYGVKAVVLDGSVPYLGLLEAVAPRPDVRLVWMRRPMWPATPESGKRLAQQRFFDLVIEPEEAAGESDQGPTVAHRDRALLVPPIRLLERDELLSREAACAALGLDPARPAVLVQLGSGTNHDVAQVTERIMAQARLHPGLQVALAEWHNSDQGMDLWPDALCLRGFPYARYFQAFDFSFAAAGYNSFHEIIDAGLPTAFVPNPREYMDMQGLRAGYAAARGAALVCDGSVAGVGAAFARLSDAAARAAMRKAMRRLRRPNGAAAAARAISDLVSGDAP